MHMDTPVYMHGYMYTHTNPHGYAGARVCINRVIIGIKSTQKPIATPLITVILLRHLSISVIQVNLKTCASMFD